jgi:hypothetical protein
MGVEDWMVRYDPSSDRVQIEVPGRGRLSIDRKIWEDLNMLKALGMVAKGYKPSEVPAADSAADERWDGVPELDLN